MKEEIEVENHQDFLPEQEQLQKEFQDQQNKEAEEEKIEEQDQEPITPITNRLFSIQKMLIIPLIEGKLKFNMSDENQDYTETELQLLETASKNIETRHPTKFLSNDIFDVITLLFIHGPKFYIKFKDKIKNLKKE